MWIFWTVLHFCRSLVCCEQHLLSFLRFPTLLISTVIFMCRRHQCQSHSLVITSGTAAHSAGSFRMGYENSTGPAFKASALWPEGHLNFYCFVGEIPVLFLTLSRKVWILGGCFFFLLPLMKPPFVSKSSNYSAQQRELQILLPLLDHPWPLPGYGLSPLDDK